jgi:hypothetical protein
MVLPEIKRQDHRQSASPAGRFSAPLASRTRSILADLMARMGHSSTRAALIYQHTAREQDKQIADALSSRIAREHDRAHNGHAKRKQ